MKLWCNVLWAAVFAVMGVLIGWAFADSLPTKITTLNLVWFAVLWLFFSLVFTPSEFLLHALAFLFSAPLTFSLLVWGTLGASLTCVIFSVGAVIGTLTLFLKSSLARMLNRRYFGTVNDVFDGK